MASQYRNLGDYESSAQMQRALNAGLKDLSMMRACDHIYYDDRSVAYKQECDTIANVRFTQSFPSLTLPGSVTLQIPNMSIVDVITGQMGINFPTNVCAPRGWGYQLIDRIDYRIGGATTYSISGEQHALSVLEKCETLNKRDQLWRLGGDAVVAAGQQYAYIFIDVPVSRIQALAPKLPFDSKMLTQPIQIIVYFKNGSQVFGGTGTIPTALSEGNFVIRQIDFKESGNSMAEDLKGESMLSYVHPFLYQQTQLVIPNLTTAQNPNFITVPLQGFRYGNLVSLTFWAVLNSNLSPAATNAVNPLVTLRLNDINLAFNGVILYNSVRDSHSLINLSNNLAPNYFETVSLAGTTSANFVMTAYNSYFYTIDMSQYSAKMKEGVIQSGLEVGSNVLTLKFSTPDSSAATFSLYVAFNYTSGIKVMQGGSQIDYVF